MKSPAANTILAFVILLALSSCRKSGIQDTEQKMYFQMDYVNYAWGYQHNGYIIDSEGNVLVYDNPSGWNFPGQNLTLSESDVEANLALCRPSGIKVPESELLRFASYIDNIASSKVTAPRQTAADAGSVEFICYRLSENAPFYKGTIIKMEGDFTCENLNYYSKKVVSWMKEIGSSIPAN